jgi:contactin associated protein-like 2
LGSTKNVTRVSIQGRPHHSEYVSEFSVSYGYNGLDYADYKEPGGNTKVINDTGRQQLNKEKFY